MLLYARIFVLCASLARIQRLQPAPPESEIEAIDQNVMNLWQTLVTTIMDQLAFLINEPSYRCQLPWAPTYPALTIAFASKCYQYETLTLTQVLSFDQLRSHSGSLDGGQA